MKKRLNKFISCGSIVIEEIVDDNDNGASFRKSRVNAGRLDGVSVSRVGGNGSVVNLTIYIEYNVNKKGSNENDGPVYLGDDEAKKELEGEGADVRADSERENIKTNDDDIGEADLVQPE